MSTDEEDYEYNNKSYPPHEEGQNGAIIQGDDQSLATLAVMETEGGHTNRTADSEIEVIEDSSDEYYSISDVEEIFNIQIRSGTQKSPMDEVS